MSKDNGNLRLLGSPVNLSYRSKKKDDKKNIRNRPRSASQSPSLTNDNTEKYKRPFSADTKDRAHSTRNFLNTFNVELLQSYNNTPNNIKIFPPTTNILGDSKTSQNHIINKDICSNASDYGSEDTFISLGTKIKNKAQLTPKNKPSNVKNFLKYRNIIKKGRKPMESCANEYKTDQNFGFNVKITEKSSRASSPLKDYDGIQVRSLSPTLRPSSRSTSPTLKNRSYESYFIPLETGMKFNKHDLAGRVSFGPSSIQTEVEQAIDTYSQRLTATKQQLSLVEEESTQDLESIPSQNLSSLSPENSLKDQKTTENHNVQENLNSVTYIANIKDKCPRATNHFIDEVRTYTSFYDDFNTNTGFKDKLASSVNTDSASKDSGYHDSGTNDDKPYRLDFSLPTTSFSKRSSSLDKLEEPKSLDSASTTSNDKSYHKTFPLDKKAQWTEPLNHSRLLYKNFFLKKEGHVAIAPQNSPIKKNISDNPRPNEVTENETFEYPSYLINSSTKAYTSKVIEDYKKELQAINNLHELTLKDIKTDVISPTPLNIDKMFEQQSSNSDDNVDKNNSPHEKTSTSKNKNSKEDISKISTKELIQNYLKVKEGDFSKDYIPKNLRSFSKKININSPSEESLASNKQIWNNSSKNRNHLSVNNTNQTQKNLFSMKQPSSARIDRVQNDKDIDSWMSMTVTSPREIELDKGGNEFKSSDNTSDTPVTEIEGKSYSPRKVTTETSNETPQAKDLTSNSTVLDIYSMLKEIESYGDHPVPTTTSVPEDKTTNEKEDDKNGRCTTPKDNFMEIFEFLEKVEQSANDALSVVTSTTPATIPKLESLLKLPQTELAQRLVTASLQLEERSCCIALLQESLANHKEQMINKVSNLEKQSHRNIAKVKQECEEAIKRHQSFIDQLINDKKTLNHRIEQLVDERRSLEERWKRSAQSLEERYKLELRNQHDKMAAAQQVARQRWVRQKAEKIKELTVKGLEGELREMAERQQQEVAALRLAHAEEGARAQARRGAELAELRARLEREHEDALTKERHLATSRLEKQILELETSHQEQRTRLVSELRAENERAAAQLAVRERQQRDDIEKWRKEQEEIIEEKRIQMEREIAEQRENIEEQMDKKQKDIEEKFEQYKKEFEAEQNVLYKKKVSDISNQHKLERDREIEKAIESMEAEAQAGRKELQEAIRRNKEQYEAELAALAATEQATLRRHQDAQARLRRAEDTCAELEVTIGQLEVRNKVLVEKNTQLETQAQEIRTSCDETWSMKIENMKKEIETMKKTHEEQMHQLYAKVKVAVSRKDSAIQALTRESAKYQEKVTLLEQKLQQQRKDFLKHK